jgi:hypothetical protein
VKYGEDFVDPKATMVALKALQEPRKDSGTCSDDDKTGLSNQWWIRCKHPYMYILLLSRTNKPQKKALFSDPAVET